MSDRPESEQKNTNTDSNPTRASRASSFSMREFTKGFNPIYSNSNDTGTGNDNGNSGGWHRSFDH